MVKQIARNKMRILTSNQEKIIANLTDENRHAEAREQICSFLELEELELEYHNLTLRQELAGYLDATTRDRRTALDTVLKATVHPSVWSLL